MASKEELKILREKTRSLRVAITYECPLKCTACYARGRKGTIDPILFEKIALEGLSLGFDTMAIGGGEPLFKVDLLMKCIGISKKMGYSTSMTSSGLNLDDELLKKLMDAGLDFFQLSLGFNRVSNMEKLNVLSRNDAMFGINFLVDKDRIDDIPSFHETFAKHGARYVVYIMPKSMERSNDHFKFRKEEVTRYLNVLIKLRESSDLNFLVDCSTALFMGNDCDGTKRGVSIAPDGKMSFCAFCGQWVPFQGTLKGTIEKLDLLHHKTCGALDKFLIA